MALISERLVCVFVRMLQSFHTMRFSNKKATIFDEKIAIRIKTVTFKSILHNKIVLTFKENDS